ncbi:putative Zn-dependent peptidase [Saccharopolyspora erythraea NRRL 2338]|uniref:Zinc protease n=2 Tax=Saccharopolyspora erythraea TaxID=1836 RepID=A4FM21_SACEN|nr:pitrilysin family protein [Saccharopolyspora erythraea]EQD88232.1 zinc protease [Saccharopolyspora erythraea D]PFG98734.1 putative Zn-dependent peptidase [Saccharopolyspora erythraea NRRL 2338]QRK88741.1 insulinase family protein [Saccharopolyspora erythraea]CAM05096.1 putative zinc protease [Saccharopolyspora erythraea NRRL 2338]
MKQQQKQTGAGHLQRPGTTRVLGRGGGGEAMRRTVLPGGLRVVTEQVPGARSASMGIWVGVGSRDESRQQAGAAHYLEHLLFKGTAKRTAVQIAQEIDAVGGELNAFTSKEHTCYYAHVLDEDLPLAVDMLCDVVFDAVNAKADVDVERSVVLEEIAMRDDDPEDLLHETFTEAVLGDHPLGRSVLGTEESIESMSRARVHGFYRSSYQLPRMVVAVAGNIEHARVLRLLRKAIGDRLDGDSAPAPPRSGRARLPRQRPLVLHEDDTEQAHLLLGCRGIDRHDERRFALGVLNAALGGGMSSRLFQEIREKRGLAYSVYSSTTAYADTGTFSVYAGCTPDRLGEVAAVVRGVLAGVAADGLTEDEVARGRGQLRGGLVLGLEDTASRMTRIGKSELNYGRHLSVAQTLERIDAVTAQDVAELAAELLQRPLTTAVVGPYGAVEDLPDGL